jgi:RNA polymerase sigma-70 factor (ECF subfamily)
MTPDPNIERVNRLFDGWYGVLVNYALGLTGRLELAEEVVQEAFYLLYRELASGKKIANEKAWTFCVVRRETGRQVYRYRLREISLDSPEFIREDGRNIQEPSDEIDRLSNLFSLLSPREEEVMLLCMESLKYREIGAVLGISSNSVATLHRRAIRKLRTVMGLEPKPVNRRGEAKLCSEDTAPIKTSSH